MRLPGGQLFRSALASEVVFEQCITYFTDIKPWEENGAGGGFFPQQAERVSHVRFFVFSTYEKPQIFIIYFVHQINTEILL